MSEPHSVIPRFGEDDARRLAGELWGLDAAAHPLPSYRDQNFRLDTAAGERFVLKIANADAPAATLDLEHQVLERLATAGGEVPPCPRVRPTTAGEAIVGLPGEGGVTHLARLVTWLDGTPLADALPHTPELLEDLGRSLGSFDRALEGFSHPGARRDLEWDPARAGWVAGSLDLLEGRERRSWVEGFCRRHEEVAVPAFGRLRRGVVHSDANPYNVLVGYPGGGRKEIAGLIDFGDLLDTVTVAEPAVAAAYVMLEKADPLAAAARVVRGYHRVRPLSEEELEVLFDLAVMRLCVSVTCAARGQRRDPDNDYLTVHEAQAWEMLERLAGTDPGFALATFRDACGLAPFARQPAVSAWIAAHREDFAPVVEPDPRTTPALVLDLSPGSPYLPEMPAERAGPGPPSAHLPEGTRADGLRAVLERALRGLAAGLRSVLGRPPGSEGVPAHPWEGPLLRGLAAAGAKMAVGRWNEARLVYSGERFGGEGPHGELGERRTVHLGLDLFLPAGTPVFAPLAGTVHSHFDESEPLAGGPTLLVEHRPEGSPAFFTLYSHLSRRSLAGKTAGETVGRGERIGEIGGTHENGGWPPHLHLQIVLDPLGRRAGQVPGVAPASQRRVWTGLSPDPGLLAGLGPERFPPPPARGEEILERRRRRLGPSLSLSYRRPLTIVRGRGTLLWDEDGRDFLDAVNNVNHVGHCHPEVVAAERRQAGMLNTNTRTLHENVVRYAERLAALLPEPLSVCFFVCSGSEANELALRLARAHTGRTGVITVGGAYHGNTQALIDASPYKYRGPGGQGPPPHVAEVTMPDPYRGRHRAPDPRAGARYAAEVSAAAAELEGRGCGASAFLCESLLGCGGQVVPPPGYLAEAYHRARRAGAVVVADEVQVGFGRAGCRFWGFETQDAVPDVVTLGKPIGNGYPLGAVVTTPEIAASFDNGMEYFNTFGGNPVACAVGLAVLEVIEKEGLQANALTVGAHLKAGLEALAGHFELIGEVRGLGLFLGVELVRDRGSREPAGEEAGYVADRMREKGVLVSTDGPDHNVLKIKPPLVFSEADADRLLAALEEVLAEDVLQGSRGFARGWASGRGIR